MTPINILKIENALNYLKARKTYPNYSKTKTEFIIDIPGCKYPGVFLKIPLVENRFILQIFFSKTNIANFKKVKKASMKTAGGKNYKTIYVFESAIVPSHVDIEQILINAKAQVKSIGII